MGEQNVPFRKSLFGFSPEKVMSYVDELLKNSDFDQIRIAELEKQLSEKDALIAELQKKADAADAAETSQKEICRNCDINKKAQSLLGEAMFDVRRFSEYLVNEAKQKASTTISGAQEKADKASEKAKKILFNVDDISSNFSSQIDDLRSALSMLTSNLDAFSKGIGTDDETELPESIRAVTQAAENLSSSQDAESRRIVEAMKSEINNEIPTAATPVASAAPVAQPTVTAAPVSQPAVFTTPVVEAPAPVVQTPVVEAPAPVVQTPVVETPAPIVQTPVVETPAPFAAPVFPAFSFGGVFGETETAFVQPAAPVKQETPVVPTTPTVQLTPDDVTTPPEEQVPVNIIRTAGTVMPENGVSPFADLFEAKPVSVTFDASALLGNTQPAPAADANTATINTQQAPFAAPVVNPAPTAAADQGLPMPPVFTKADAPTFTVPDSITSAPAAPAPAFTGTSDRLPDYNPAGFGEDEKKTESFTFVNQFRLKPNTIIKTEPVAEDPIPPEN